MNFEYDFNSSSNTTLMDVRMMPHHHHHSHQAYNPNLMHSRNTTTTSHADDLNGANHTFDCLIHEVDGVHVECITNESKSDEENDRFDLMNQSNSNQLIQQQQQQNHLNLNENIGLKTKQANRTSSNTNLCSNMEKNLRFETSTANNKFHYVLMAPTSPAVKANEDTLTYLNQGQNYELRINRVGNNMLNSSSINGTASATSTQNGSAFMNESRQIEDIKPLIVDSKLNKNLNDDQTMNRIICVASDSESAEKLTYHNLNDSSSSSNCPLYMSIVRICFWDRKLQEIEHEEIKEWKKEYSNVRMLEIDNTSSFGTVDIRLSDMFTNAAEVIWNGKTGASLFFRCNCTSTAFAPNKHGGEKGIHMRFQIDTFELLNNSTKYQSNLMLNNYYQASNFSPSNSSSLSSSSSSSSSSSFLSQDLKLAKDDFDCISSNLKDKEQENYRSPSPIIDYSTGNYWKHLCSSYCRIQLFRLKGAQRKLKTDKSKIERLNPPDLRKRYQPSNKVTVLCNSQFDPLYSLLPFSRYINSNTNNNITNAANTPDGSIDNCLNMMDNRSLSVDYSGLNPTNTSYYINNNLSATPQSMLNLYNSDTNTAAALNSVSNYAIQPILVVQQQQPVALQLNKPKTNELTNLHSQTNEQGKVQLITSSSSLSSSSASSTASQDDSNYFIETNQYYDNNKSLQTDMTTSQHMSIVNSSNNEDANNNYSDELVYTRLKRASSISSLNSNASYGSNGNNTYNYKNAKFQKTCSMSSVQSQNKYINLSPSYNTTLTQQYQTNAQQAQSALLSATSNSNSTQQIYTQQLMNPSNNLKFMNDPTKLNQFNSVPAAVNLDSTSLYKSKMLPNDCNFKYVQEWLIANRFGHLLHLFANYTSNDLLRLSKEDMISLCGAPDGIRCFNIAHNIQIKPKLTIFVTFQNQTYFSAVFLADWKSNFLIQKLLSLYSSFITSLNENKKTNDESDDSESNESTNQEGKNESISESSKTKTLNKSHNETINNSELNSEKNNEILLDHQQIYEKILNSKLDYELFLKIKDILVQTTDEVLNNLNDQSRFLVKFELPQVSSSSPAVPTTPNMSPTANEQSKNFQLNNFIKILMIPLD